MVSELDSAARRTASGSFFLSGGNFLGFALAAIGSIGIARLLGPTSYGIVSVALIIPSLIPPLTDLGFSTAVVRFASLEKDPTDYIGTVLVVKATLSAAIACGLFAVAVPLANLLGRPYLVPMTQVLSVYTFSYTMLGVLTGALVGLGKYPRASLVSLLGSSLRVAVSLALVLSGLGVYGAVLGFPIGVSVVVVLAFGLLRGDVKRIRFNRLIFKELLSYSWPLYLPALVAIPASYYSNLLIAFFLDNATIGNYSVASNLLLPLSVASGSISTALLSGLPTTGLDSEGMMKNLNSAMKYTTIIIPGVAMALIALANPITMLIYGSRYTSAPLLLILLALTGLLAPLGSTVLGTYFSTIGDTRTNMFLGFANLGVNVPVTLVLVSRYGVVGIIIGSLAASLAVTLFALYIARSKYSFRPELAYSFSLLIPSLVAAAISILVTELVPGASWEFIVGGLTYMICFAFTLPVFTRKEDIRKLKNLFLVVGVLGRIASKVFDMELRLSDFFDSIRSGHPGT